MMLLNSVSGSTLFGLLLVYGIFGIIIFGNYAAAVYFLIKAVQNWYNDRRK